MQDCKELLLFHYFHQCYTQKYLTLEKEFKSSNSKSVGGTGEGVWIQDISLEILESAFNSLLDLIHIQHNIGMLQDPVELAPDIDAELLVHFIVLQGS